MQYKYGHFLSILMYVDITLKGRVDIKCCFISQYRFGLEGISSPISDWVVILKTHEGTHIVLLVRRSLLLTDFG
jgi:hypothetical protein